MLALIIISGYLKRAIFNLSFIDSANRNSPPRICQGPPASEIRKDSLGRYDQGLSFLISTFKTKLRADQRFQVIATKIII